MSTMKSSSFEAASAPTTRSEFFVQYQVRREKYSISTIIRWQKKKKGADDLQSHVNIARRISKEFYDIVGIRERQNPMPKLVDTILELAGARALELENDIGILEREGISPIEVLWSKNLSKEGSCDGAAEHASPQRKRTRSSTTPTSLSWHLKDKIVSSLTLLQSSQERLELSMTSKFWH